MKETAIIPVTMAILYDYLLLGRKRRLSSALAYLPLLCPLAAYLLLHPLVHPGTDRNVSHTLATIPYIGLLSCQKLIWSPPVAQFYDLWIDQPHSGLSLFMHTLGLICILGVVLWAGSRSRLVAWTLALIVLPIAIVAVGCFFFRDYDLFHDRYLYLSSVGVAILIADLLVRTESQLQLRRLTVMLSAFVLSAEIVHSHIALPQFHDDRSLFARAVEVAPQNIVALQLMAENAIKDNNCPSAIEAYQRAQQARPDLWKTSFYLGIGYSHCGKAKEAGYAFDTATRAPGATAKEAALAWYEMGRMSLFQDNQAGALAALRKAASLDPASRKIQTLLTETLSR